MAVVVVGVVIVVVDDCVPLPARLPALLLLFRFQFPANLWPPVEPELVVGHVLGHDQPEVDVVAHLHDDENVKGLNTFFLTTYFPNSALKYVCNRWHC